MRGIKAYGFRAVQAGRPVGGGAGRVGMTAHIVYPALDKDNPATLSSRIISDIIREEIGFDGFLVGTTSI